ncbi:hypothetical protein M885DRAFT_514717 [Pelagophyceae sp. CCMP2097]|nr:hypothetical protein M885DRAFT_514717 [Pelagophyceae sp. CCMP2097]|mmetsp:Transcript_14605/g.48970  ORF Transcript_14605/g.48970 Transcript_14605/m.48970 type:complete len:220 (-) Transcript_14605:15-674(-)
MNRLLFVVLLGASRALRVSRQPISSAIPTWKRRLPNALTCARLGAVPVVAAALCTPSGAPGIACGAFALASVTDWFDGALARRWRVESDFGKFFDPVADKLLVTSTLVLLTPRIGMACAVPAAIIVVREIAVSALRERMAALGRSGVVQVNWAGKLKTATQMVALAALLASHHRRASTLHAAGLALLWTSAALALQSGAMLFSAAWPGLFPSREDEAGP